MNKVRTNKVCIAKAVYIIASVIICCTVMAYIDGFLRPGYLIKSVIKLCLFSGAMLIYTTALEHKSLSDIIRSIKKPSLSKKGITISLCLGIGVYAVIVGAYFLLKNFFDFSGLVKSLTSETGVNKDNFLFVSLYISFVNSLLEESFFRGFAFSKLSGLSKLSEPSKPAGNIRRMLPYAFSALAFSLYHVAMMLWWFDFAVFLLALLGLAAGGIIFNVLESKTRSIFPGWMVHMFANFAINTVGFILFSAL